MKKKSKKPTAAKTRKPKTVKAAEAYNSATRGLRAIQGVLNKDDNSASFEQEEELWQLLEDTKQLITNKKGAEVIKLLDNQQSLKPSEIAPDPVSGAAQPDGADSIWSPCPSGQPTDLNRLAWHYMVYAKTIYQQENGTYHQYALADGENQPSWQFQHETRVLDRLCGFLDGLKFAMHLKHPGSRVDILAPKVLNWTKKLDYKIGKRGENSFQGWVKDNLRLSRELDMDYQVRHQSSFISTHELARLYRIQINQGQVAPLDKSDRGLEMALCAAIEAVFPLKKDGVNKVRPRTGRGRQSGYEGLRFTHEAELALQNQERQEHIEEVAAVVVQADFDVINGENAA